MDRMPLGLVVVRHHPVILSSCLRLDVSFLCWIPVSGLSNVEGQRREPVTGDVRLATRRAGWRPFAGPPGLTSFRSNRRRVRCSRLPMKPFISLFSTGWQDGQDAFGSRRGP